MDMSFKGSTEKWNLQHCIDRKIIKVCGTQSSEAFPPYAMLILDVPEAAASSDTIQFKLVLGGEDLAQYLADHEDQLVQPTVFRSFQQISWVHEKLTKALPEVMVPPLPEPPISARMDDQDYVERKRLQVARLMEKLAARSEFTSNPDFVHFLSSEMSPTQVGRSGRGVLSFLRFNRVIHPNSDRGFKSYKATEPVEGNDHDTFHRHQIYILMLETYFGTMAESLGHLIHSRETLADALTHMGDLIIETTQSKYRLGNGASDEHRKAQRALDHKMQLFGLLMDELGFIATRQGIEENMKFGDVMIEYKNAMESLKTVFNARTQKLMQYADSMKHRNKKRDKADRLKLRLGMHAPEVKATVAEEEEATRALEAKRQDFDDCQARVKDEIKLFEAQKHHDIKRAINDYVQLNLRYERSKLASLEKSIHEIQQFNPKPVALAYPVISDEESSAASSSTHDTSRRRKRRKRRSSKRCPQAIQSSASFPTWTRKEQAQNAQEEEEDNNEERDETAAPTSSARVSPFVRYEGQPRVHLSSSYDERLGGNSNFPL